MSYARLICIVALLLTGISTFAQSNPVPAIIQPLVPANVVPGAADFTLTVNGVGFVPGSVVNWSGSALTTTFVSGAKLTAAVPASKVTTQGTASVSVVSPAPGGGTSNSSLFDIRTPFLSASFGQTDFTAGGAPSLPVTADFNGDGFPDVAVIADNDAAISVLLGNGDGTFALAQEYPVGTVPEGLVVGDFNGDGILDLATCDFLGFASVLLGRGDGTFQPRKDSPTAAFADALAVGDFNGDGKLDLAVAIHYPTGQVAILLGSGDGTFGTPVPYSVGGDASGIAVGDFNADGKSDLAVTDFSDRTVAILIGNGDGTFQDALFYGTNFEPKGVVAADFNGDGKTDVAVKTLESVRAAGISIFLGNGDGTFQSSIDYPASADYYLSAADVNGDSRLDLIVASDRSAAVFLGTGDGHFHKPNIFPTSGFSVGAAVADFNGDGLVDIVVGNDTNTVTLLPQLTAVLSQTLVDFGRVKVGTTLSSKVKLTNIGSEVLAIGQIGLQGQDAAQFAEVNDCGSTLPSGATCKVTVSFTPIQAGTYKKARVAIKDSSAQLTQKVNLAGVGLN